MKTDPRTEANAGSVSCAVATPTPQTATPSSAEVEQFYRLADALKAADRTLNTAPYGKSAELDALLDRKIYPGDLGDLAKAVFAIAEAAQEAIDASLAAEDR